MLALNPVLKVQRHTCAQRGFTLMELLIVMVILGLMASLVAPNLFKRVDTANIRTAESQIQMLSTAIDAFRLDVGRFPRDLNELIQSDERRWQGPYIPRIPLDPWDQPYQYRVPGEHHLYDLYSEGDGENIIGNWKLNQ